MARLGDRKGEDGKFHAPSIHTGDTKEPMKKYYFENRKQPGNPLSFFAPGEKGIEQHYYEHGTEVEMTESMAQHIKSKGVMKPIMEESAFGLKDSKRRYCDRRFDLNEV